MPKPTDITTVSSVALWHLPVSFRAPLKFGSEVVNGFDCARVRLRIRTRNGAEAEGWGETPLSASWVWPGSLSFAERAEALKAFCARLAALFVANPHSGHPIEIGHAFLRHELERARVEFNATERAGRPPLPHLAALVCCSAFDLALHDAYGRALQCPTYSTYTAAFMNRDLTAYLSPAADSSLTFHGLYPADFFVHPPSATLPVWHLVGGQDALDEAEAAALPQDGHPVTLAEWIRRDGLRCLKIKLRGTDAAWDYDRIVRVGRIAVAQGVDWLSTDFNCTVTDPAYVTDILDRLLRDEPRIYGMLLYVEQPFPYDLEEHRIDVHAVSARKPLFLDESAHDWQMVRLGRLLGWTGVALKTCKTQTGALLSLCWARRHGMTLMVQDLTNPALAMIPHVQLAAHAGTIMGVESNAPQFCPAASEREAGVYPGIYVRRNGVLDRSALTGAGMGNDPRLAQVSLPTPVAEFGLA